MNILGFDTCFGVCSAALGVGLNRDPCIFSRSEIMSTGHAERLLPMIDELLTLAEISVEHLDKIAVTYGPGSFTGVRISVAAARAFRLARQIPIVPFTSLEAIALHPEIKDLSMDKDLIVAIDANRGEAYVQVFDGSTKESLGEPQLMGEKSFLDLGRGRPIFVVGTAAQKVTHYLISQSREAQFYEGALWPAMSEAIIKASTRPSSDKAIEPLYIREPDAKPPVLKNLLPL